MLAFLVLYMGHVGSQKSASDLRIQHGLTELVSSSYGQVVAFYNKGRSLSADSDIDLRIRNASKIKGAQKVKLSKEQAEVVKSAIAEVDKQVVDEFETRFSAWVQTWDVMVYGTPFRSIVSYDSAKNLRRWWRWEPIFFRWWSRNLPTQKIFFALQLYDALQPEAMSIVHIDPEDDAILEGEQGRAERTVERWIANL